MFKFGTSKIIEGYPNASGKRALLVIETVHLYDDELFNSSINNNVDKEQVMKHRYVSVELTPDGFNIPDNFIGKRTEYIISRIVDSINENNGYTKDDVDDILESMYGLGELDEPLVSYDPIYTN